MAGDALDIGVSGSFVAGELGCHRVADLTTEFGALGVVIALVAAEEKDNRQQEGTGHHQEEIAAVPWIAEIDRKHAGPGFFLNRGVFLVMIAVFRIGFLSQSESIIRFNNFPLIFS